MRHAFLEHGRNDCCSVLSLCQIKLFFVYFNMIGRSCCLQIEAGSFLILFSCLFEAKADLPWQWEAFRNFLQFILFSGAVGYERTRHNDVVRQFPEQTSSVQYACTQIEVFMRGSGSDWRADASPLSECES